MERPGRQSKFPGLAQGQPQPAEGISQNPGMSTWLRVAVLHRSQRQLLEIVTAGTNKRRTSSHGSRSEKHELGYDQWTLSDSGREASNHNARWSKDHPGAVPRLGPLR